MVVHAGSVFVVYRLRGVVVGKTFLFVLLFDLILLLINLLSIIRLLFLFLSIPVIMYHLEHFIFVFGFK